jgi:6-phosphofructokinase 1
MPLSLFDQGPVALLFSGGDSPGMNAFLRAAVRLGMNRDQAPVLGILEGYSGLVRTVKQLEAGEITLQKLRRNIARRPGVIGLKAHSQHIVRMDQESVSGLVVQGGIMLRSARSMEFREPERRQQIIQLLHDLKVRALIVCGGDGSLAGAEALKNESDLQVIGVPGTIDNDLPITDFSLGVHSAIGTLVREIDAIKDTARSHRRVMVMETMGRHSGELTQLAAIASGAEHAIIPEDGFLTNDRIRKLAEEMEGALSHGRSHSIVLVAEGVQMDKHPWESPAWVVSSRLAEAFRHGPFKDIETRATVLGHLQRGGRPAPYDALLAAEFASVAWDAIAAGRQSGVTVLQNGEFKLVPFGSPPACDREARLKRLHLLHASLSAW